ncbi:hypothetical protein TgHK011_006013 [Trichoderma gracile]|nr:hypothetical protein TgHK011_006013 [Trichoderma gracile]
MLSNSVNFASLVLRRSAPNSQALLWASSAPDGGPSFLLRRFFSSLSSGVRPRAAAGGLAETGQRQHVPWPLRHLHTQAPNPRARRALSSEISIAEGVFTYDTTPVGHRALVLPYRHYL